ncbi:MAG: DeoR/GlpR family DNA-binding transcription regulator [Acidimicrobiales bacterium]|jgi:DeoR family transcriptional regulator of aga operon
MSDPMVFPDPQGDAQLATGDGGPLGAERPLTLGRGAGNLRPRIRDSRLRAITEIIDENGAVGVDELSELLAVSMATIRRDLARLADQGVITRSHGGALRSDSGLEVPISYRRGKAVPQKRRIAAAAASLIGEGAIVGVTGGTTTIEVARALASVRKLTVVTNALNVGMELARHRNIRLVLTGGVCRTASFELSGPIAESTLSGYNLDVAFVGVDGIDVDAGCTTHDDAEARANAALVKIARRTVIVADSSKIGRVTFASICPLDLVDHLITDNEGDPQDVSRLEAAGLRVVVA